MTPSAIQIYLGDIRNPNFYLGGISTSDTDANRFTHTAHVFKSEVMRRGRRIGYWVQEGYARQNPDGSGFVSLHSTPIGSFDGRMMLTPIGKQPPQPSAPTLTGDEIEDDENEE